MTRKMNTLAKRFAHIAAWLALALAPAASRAADGSQLKPPPGARVAIVMFEDLECPDCARAYPVVWEAARKHNVPVVLHDFPLQMHPWSFDAAVFARYFDSKSEKLGDDFRGYIFKNRHRLISPTCASMSRNLPMTTKRPSPLLSTRMGSSRPGSWQTDRWGRKLACNIRPRSLSSAMAALPLRRLKLRTAVS